MDFRPSPAQQLLVSTARDFLRRHCPAERLQHLALDPHGFDEALWRRMAELGWHGLLVPPEHGGSGGSVLDAVLLVEEMGRAGAPGPFVPSAVVATTLVTASGSAEQRKRLLPAMAAGERIVGVGLVDDDGSFDPGRIALVLDGHGRLAGRTLFVEAAHVAHDLVVAARAGGDVAVCLVPADAPGLARRPLDTITPEKVFEVTFDGVPVGADRRLAAGRAALTAAVEAGALARAAEMVGAAQRVLELAVEHARTRVQGGRPIGAYQAIQHACADLVRDVDASRGLVYAAAWKVSEGAPAAADVAMAKAYAGEACLAVARRAHQIFGAIGYCEEHPLHLLHKRIHAASLDYGDAPLHLETVARAIGLQ